MKTSKIFGLVLSLHVGFIVVLMVQPGCRTSQPPTKTYQQKNTLGLESSERLGDLIPATRADHSIDPAFNANIDGGGNYGFDGREEPLRPSSEFSEFDSVGEPLTPVVDASAAIDITGSSFETYVVKKGDNLWSISRRKNVSLNEIYVANKLNKNSVLNIGQQIRIPLDRNKATVSTVTSDVYQPSALNSETTMYKVRSGDTLSGIARKYDTTVGAVKAANNRTSDMIRIGEALIIPVSAASVSDRFESSTFTAKDHKHIVKVNESPAGIASIYGMTIQELLAVNGISDPSGIRVGQELIVRATGTDVRAETSGASVLQVSGSKPVANDGPVEINVIPAEPMIEENVVLEEVDALFENAVEIPVIRLDSE